MNLPEPKTAEKCMMGIRMYLDEFERLKERKKQLSGEYTEELKKKGFEVGDKIKVPGMKREEFQGVCRIKKFLRAWLVIENDKDKEIKIKGYDLERV